MRVYNARGACLAAACLSDQVRPGVLQMATSALSCLVEVQRFVGELPPLTCHKPPPLQDTVATVTAAPQ